MRRQLYPAFAMVVLMTVITGLLYTFAFTGVAQVVAKDEANGSLVQVDGRDVGARVIGQAWVTEGGDALPEYFQSRPSAATNGTDNGYDPTLSLGSNYGPSNPDFLQQVERRVAAYRKLNGLSDDAEVPVDAVTASASGLDPHISVANARLQANRVADERDLAIERVNELVDDHTEGRTLGILGEKRVNVLQLNLALDREVAAR